MVYTKKTILLDLSMIELKCVLMTILIKTRTILLDNNKSKFKSNRNELNINYCYHNNDCLTYKQNYKLCKIISDQNRLLNIFENLNFL